MLIKLEITASNPDEYLCALRGLLASAPATLVLAADEQRIADVIIPSSDNGSSPDREHGGSTPSEGATSEVPAVETVVTKRLTKAKQAKLDAEAAAKPLPSDPLPDVMTGGTTIENDETSEAALTPKALTLDGDIKPRLQAIQAAHTKRGNDMPSCVAYIQRLYGPFGISHIKHLPEASYAEFMEASEPYLEGTA